MSAVEQPATLPLPALEPPRRYLFGPGPSMVHPRVYEALSKPIVGHLDPYFIQVMADVQQLLKTAYGTNDGATLVISGTGSAGMEAAVANFVEPGSKLAVFANGYFSDRLTEMAKRNGANVVRFEKNWGETYTDDEAKEFIARGKCEFIRDYANPFTLLVIADLLGVPESEHDTFRQELQEDKRTHEPDPGERRGPVSHKPLEFLYDRFAGYIEDRRREPRASARSRRGDQNGRRKRHPRRTIGRGSERHDGAARTRRRDDHGADHGRGTKPGPRRSPCHGS